MLKLTRFTSIISVRTGVTARALATASSSGPLEAEGVKSILKRHLAAADRPLTSEELWGLTEAEGVKSKRHMKQMLQQMRVTQVVATKPLGASSASKKNRQHGYLLSERRTRNKPAVEAPSSA